MPTNPMEVNPPTSYRPTDNTDVGQATLFANLFKDTLRYSKTTGFLVFNGRYWEENDLKAQAAAQELTAKQLEYAEELLTLAQKKAEQTSVLAMLEMMGTASAEKRMNDEQRQAYRELCAAKTFHKFALSRRSSRSIHATLEEACPMLEIDHTMLDHNPFLLGTPTATYDLRQGLAGARPHSPEDYITKMTAVSPGDKGADLWAQSLNQFFCGNQDLIEYVQQICGLAALGKTFVEAIYIAYGGGRNGKSSFWNAISKVLGLYSSSIAADVLTFHCVGNVKNELAEICGKRFLIAAELPANARLNDSLLKQLCSTDDITANKKFKDTFCFTPSHTVVLYTNHLPEVAARDDGTWNRMIVIPFKAKFDGNSTIKNYAEYLFDNAGESILSWIIEGAKKIIEANYHLKTPACVEQAIAEYRASSDWFNKFLDACCDVGADYRAASGNLYSIYRSYCQRNNENACSTTAFYNALETAGFPRIKVNGCKYVNGLRIKPNCQY